MNPEQLKTFLLQHLLSPVINIQPVGGGSINQTYKIITSGNSYFCKTNSASKFPHLLEKEKSGLAFIQQQNKIATPSIFAHGLYGDEQLLIMEWVEEGIRDNKFWKDFGEQLALLHTVSRQYFGWVEDNFMGSVPQNNHQQKNWVSFFIEQRIQPLVKLCIDNMLLSFTDAGKFEHLYNQLPSLFNEEKPSLLHGDLWNGNFMCRKDGQPVLIDPAIYFGHRSMDLGMTTLFGGFDKIFYEAYHHHFPFPNNYREQWEVCNLYPLLIHLFLFGTSYLRPINKILTCFNCK